MKSSDTCAICEKPFPNEHRFLHFVRHIRSGEAVGHFDKQGNWWFEKVQEPEGEKVGG